MCSIDKAASIGMNWWQHDPRLTTRPVDPGALGSGDVEKRLERIEQQSQLTERSGAKRRPSTSTE